MLKKKICQKISSKDKPALKQYFSSEINFQIHSGEVFVLPFAEQRGIIFADG